MGYSLRHGQELWTLGPKGQQDLKLMPIYSFQPDLLPPSQFGALPQLIHWQCPDITPFSMDVHSIPLAAPYLDHRCSSSMSLPSASTRHCMGPPAADMARRLVAQSASTAGPPATGSYFTSATGSASSATATTSTRSSPSSRAGPSRCWRCDALSPAPSAAPHPCRLPAVPSKTRRPGACSAHARIHTGA